MTYAPTSSGYAGPGQAPKRPVTLLILQVISGLSAVLPAVAAIMVFAGGKKMAEDQLIADLDTYAPELAELGAKSDEASALTVELMKGFGEWEPAVASFQGSLATISTVEIVLAVLVAAWTVLARATWARVLITVFSVIGILIHFVFIGGITPPDSVAALLMVTWIFNVLAIIFCWLPPTNRYAKSTQMARAA